MNRRAHLALLSGVFVILWALLAIAPIDRSTWWLENTLLIAGAGILVGTRRTLPLSGSSYSMLFVFFCLHAIGAHYTYSLVPYDQMVSSLSGSSLNEALGLQRNHYDRLVHLAYGLLLALPLRELLMLHAGVRGFWSYFLPIDVVASSSLAYELIEWAAALAYGGDLGIAFLGTQGDEWDAHRDMALASLGALLTMLLVATFNRIRGSDLTLEWFERIGRLREETR